MKQAWSRICNQVKRVYKASPWVRWAAVPALLLGCAVLVELFFFQGKLLRFRWCALGCNQRCADDDRWTDSVACGIKEGSSGSIAE